ncbi:MAG TPA: hypothetical protein VKF17_05230, partial [Isosphaeraceae bacterium]|nr:hypothetical protein [Isosphaeraceae bacterium]
NGFDLKDARTGTREKPFTGFDPLDGFFWPSSAPPSSDFVLNVRQSSGSFFLRMARHSRSSRSSPRPTLFLALPQVVPAAA